MFTISHFSPRDTQETPTLRPMETVGMLADWLPTAREDVALIACDFPGMSFSIIYSDPDRGKTTVKAFTPERDIWVFDKVEKAERHFVNLVKNHIS